MIVFELTMPRNGFRYFYDKDITHWMSLPELPKGENNGD